MVLNRYSAFDILYLQKKNIVLCFADIERGINEMSYEEDYRKPYRSSCACGHGFLRYYKIFESNDWGQERVSETPIEIHCDYCKAHYYDLKKDGDVWLVPDGLAYPSHIAELDRKYKPTDDEVFVANHTQDMIKTMIDDMESSRYMSRLSYPPAVEYAQAWYYRARRKSLSPMVASLCQIRSKYNELLEGYKKKKPYLEDYKKKCQQYEAQVQEIERKSFLALFSYDEEQDLADHKQTERENEALKRAHQYDDFDAKVKYHDSCKVDSTGCFWDTLKIKKCLDPEYLVLNKPEHGHAIITIVKKYLCECTICSEEYEVLSSEFEIEYDEERGFKPKFYCNCHKVSSFEAKTMDIFNNLGISYVREYSFADLVGDAGRPLRFDFAVFNSDSPTDKENILFLLELQGPHHYKQGEYDEFGDFIEDNISISSKERVRKQKRYDFLKKQYCEEKHIALESIKYTENKSYEALEKLLIAILAKYKLVVIPNENRK